MQINFSNQLKGFVSELKLELSMRRKVWRRVAGQEHKFVKPEQQGRYDAMRLMLKTFDEMTPKELETIVQRIQRRKALAKQQGNLFQ